MADTGKQVLDGSSFTAWGQSLPSLAAFRQYFEVLNRYRNRLSACGIDFSSLPADKDGAYWEKEYHKEDDIDIKAFRDSSAGLKAAGQGVQAQADLIQQTENLHEHWNDSASKEALDNYLTHQAHIHQDLNDLRDQAATAQQAAESIEHALGIKATDASVAVNSLVNTALRNSLLDFDTRLRTGCEAMEANNQGGSGPFGLGSNQHRYQHHGSGSGTFDLGGGGENWSATDVRRDIQNSVIGGFAATCKTLDESNKAIEQHLRDSYSILLKSLGAGDGPPPFKGVTLEQLEQIYPNLSSSEAERFLPYLNRAMEAAGATIPQEQAAFLATFGVETSELRLWREGEYINSDGSHGYGISDEEFDQDYAGVNGNIYPHDGSLYKGRGPIQLTGRAEYQKFNDWYNSTHSPQVDFMTHPELLEDRANHPEYGFAAAQYYWSSHNLSDAADQGGIVAVTNIVNKGDPNLQSKIDYYNRALSALGG